MSLSRGALPGQPSSSQSTPGGDSPPVRRLRRGALLYTAALLTLGAAASHVSGLLGQPPGSGLLAGTLLAGALIQCLTAFAPVVSPTRRLLIVAAAVEGLSVAGWLAVRTTGVPLGSMRLQSVLPARPGKRSMFSNLPYA